MSEAPPQLGDIPHQSEMSIPQIGNNDSNLSSPNGGYSLQAVKDSIYSNAQSAANTAQNHPVTQNFQDTVANGPVAEKMKDQSAKTSSEFRNLADSRAAPNQKTATEQPLTHYHSFFYNLLSWQNPRATAIAFVSSILLIFAARYLPVLRWTFKATYITLGIAAAAEVAGKLILSQGLASSFRPRKYYTIPRESLESSLEDVEQLINFFVIEFQRVLFAENVSHTIAAFAASLISYWLIKFTPVWGLCLISTSVLYLTPLVYVNNKELIDHHLQNASNIVNQQTHQLKDMAGHHAGRASSTVKSYAGDYTSKAQDYIGNVRGRSNSPEVANKSSNTPIKSEPGKPSYTENDFPHAPKQDLNTPGVKSHEQQYQESHLGGQAQPSY